MRVYTQQKKKNEALGFGGAAHFRLRITKFPDDVIMTSRFFFLFFFVRPSLLPRHFLKIEVNKFVEKKIVENLPLLNKKGEIVCVALRTSPARLNAGRFTGLVEISYIYIFAPSFVVFG